MKCAQCGQPIPKKENFCGSCGAKAPSKKTFPWIPVLSIALGLSLIANIVLLFVSHAPHKFEKKGFSSPAAAITAFAEAFRDGDVEQMVATFAVESYVAGYDLEGFLNKSFFYEFQTMEIGLPNDSHYKEQINHYTRVSQIVRHIQNGYFTLTGVDNSDSFLAFNRRQEGEVDAFFQQLRSPDFDEMLSQIEIGDVLTKDDFDIDEEVYSHNLDYLSSYLDVEEFRDVAIEITFDGEEYYLFMLTAKIDGRWYNIQLGGTLGFQNGLDILDGGFLKK